LLGLFFDLKMEAMCSECQLTFTGLRSIISKKIFFIATDGKASNPKYVEVFYFCSERYTELS
jgi:hypothetical protein